MRLRHTEDVRLARAAYQQHPTNNLIYLDASLDWCGIGDGLEVRATR